MTKTERRVIEIETNDEQSISVMRTRLGNDALNIVTVTIKDARAPGATLRLTDSEALELSDALAQVAGHD